MQRNLVYVVGLGMDICYEDVLRGSEYFGQFGKPVKVSPWPPRNRDRWWSMTDTLPVVDRGCKVMLSLGSCGSTTHSAVGTRPICACMQVSVNRSMPPGVIGAKSGPSGSAYVTFRRPQDAQQCIENIDGAIWQGEPSPSAGSCTFLHTCLRGLVSLGCCAPVERQQHIGPSNIWGADVLTLFPTPAGIASCRADGAGVLWHHEVLQRVPEGRAVQQHRLPLPPRRG